MGEKGTAVAEQVVVEWLRRLGIIYSIDSISEIGPVI